MYSDLKERILPLIYGMTASNGQEIVKILDEYEQIHKGCISWCAEDVISRAVECGYKVPTQEEAWGIVEQTIDDHDCNYGITWQSFDEHMTPLTGESEDASTWTNEELFNYLTGTHTIDPYEEKFEEWTQSRERMIELVQEQINEQ